MTKRKFESRIAEELCAEVNQPRREAPSHPEGLPKFPKQPRPTGARDAEAHVAAQGPRLVHVFTEGSEVDKPVDMVGGVAITGDVINVELAREGGIKLHPFWGLLQQRVTSYGDASSR